MKMNILMFGWELPPRISGGLGVACDGLLTGLGVIGATDVTFVVPHLFGGEEESTARLVPAFGHGSPTAAEPLVRAAKVKQIFAGGVAFGPRVGAYDSGAVAEAEAFATRVAQMLPDMSAPDVIHAHDWLTFLAGIEAKKALGCPLVAHVHSTEFDRAGRNINPGIADIERIGMRAADRVIAVSEVTRRTVIDRYGVDAGKVVVVHNGAWKGAGEARAKLCAGQTPTVAFIGRITHQKGPRYFIEAASKVLEQTRNVRFVMAGSGDLMPMAKALTSTLGVREYFDFPGFLSATGVTRLLATADIYVMPSVAEPFGIGALEAIHAGVPLIISKQCGVGEVIEHAMKVNPLDTGEIADAILACMADPEAALRRAALARQEAVGLTWERAAGKVAALYQSLSGN